MKSEMLELVERVTLELALCNVDNELEKKLHNDINILRDVYTDIEDEETRMLGTKLLFAYELNELIKRELANLI